MYSKAPPSHLDRLNTIQNSALRITTGAFEQLLHLILFGYFKMLLKHTQTVHHIHYLHKYKSESKLQLKTTTHCTDVYVDQELSRPSQSNRHQ